MEPLQPFLSDIIDAVADPIFVKDEQHRFILMNESMCKLLGYPREELLGKSDFDFFPEDEARVFWAKDNEVFQSGKTVENEESLTDADGYTSIISTKKSVFLNDRGEKILVGVIRDLTHIKQTERELRIARDQAQKANEAKTRFLANASHELRTPLSGIVSVVELLEDRPWEGDLQDLVAVLKDSAQNLLHLVNDLLDFSAVDSGRVALRSETYSPQKLMAAISALFEPQLNKRHLKLQVQIDNSVPQFVSGDQNRLRQILVNLISNSAKFTPEKGGISVLVKVESNVLRFDIRDSGIGIPTEQLESVFLPFFKARRTDQGTGLGLAICRQLAELMEGRLWLEPSDRGCHAVLEIPFSRAEAPAQNVDVPDPPKSLPGLEILLVEDDPVSQKVATLTLTRMNCQVTLAEDGLKALELLEKQSFDLIIMDCRMPNLDGYETARRIREKEKDAGSRVPIIALTAHAFEEDREKCLSAGMDYWLVKPLQRKHLVTALSNFFPRPSC